MKRGITIKINAKGNVTVVYSYKKQLSKLLAKHGRVREWVIKQSGMPRTTFERKVRQDTLTAEEKSKIESLIITGK